MKIDPKTRRALEETGLPWELENGKKHTKIRLAGQFVGMYVNDMTLDMGEQGKKAVEEFLGQAHQAGLVPNALPIELV